MFPSVNDTIVFREATADDKDLIYEHVKAVHEEDILPVMDRLFGHKSDYQISDNFVAYDTEKNIVVSYLCLIRHALSIDGSVVPVAQMDFVGTLPEYRNRGHIRQLNELFEAKAISENIPLYLIGGIPYFYREFGYEYAIPMLRRMIVAKDLIPKLDPSESEPVLITPIDHDTFDLYLEAREQRNSFLDMYKTISLDDREFILECELGTATGIELYVLQKDSKIVGMFVLEVDWGNMQIEELWVDDFSYLPTIFRFVREKADKHNVPISIDYPSDPSLIHRLEVMTQASFSKSYAWYTKIPDIRLFLDSMRTAFGKRLETSRYNGYTGSFRLCTYREGFDIVFKSGKVENVRKLPRSEMKSFDVYLPPVVVNQLLLGYRNFTELWEFYPDVTAPTSKILLVETLFPKLNSDIRPQI
ncbi:MAG: GNAT family N-acetyltransferase [Candidatus Lokiarchaeota archaeon]|nr:GNAT family N-acetyltransferase [Candidatus Lokiarchaeota archaeon]